MRYFHPDLTAHLTDRELRELTDWTWLQNRQPSKETFDLWLASPWGELTVRDWLNNRTNVRQGALDDEKLLGREAF
ncbi:MAG: hypothetical protein HY834_14820 [Devosia nanyangense]|uniref:Uncharacterized protein n=1 Tax=Devosia nanyangense TaxID=1228055 RepID=A0A933NZ61_9HYPH|nr:hypothetical protein [Devosia nanyangense]